MKWLLKSVLPARVRLALREWADNRFGGHAVRSYSQEGEDMVLRRIFENRASGFYVDVGAHHPFRLSNTCYFHEHGWRGINIDAMPGSMAPFRRYRPGDVNLEVPISDHGEVLTYYSFNEPALNGFSRELSEERAASGIYFVKEEIRLQTRRLAEILEEHLPAGTDIDFLSVDVEGHDLEVLRSNDWQRFRPKVVLVEILGDVHPGAPDRGEIQGFLEQAGYRMFAKTFYTSFFVESRLFAELFKAQAPGPLPPAGRSPGGGPPSAAS